MKPRTIAIVAGSGVDIEGLIEEPAWERSFSDFAGLPFSTVAGHASRFIGGSLMLDGGDRIELVLQQGRRHAYEGSTFTEIARTVDILRGLGADAVLFTNAAGGLCPDLAAGSVVSVEEIHCWPCRAMRLPQQIRPPLLVTGCDASGVYAFMHGPCYETPSEIASLRAMGALLVGMSTAPEMLRCEQVGLPAAAVSIVTNVCGDAHVSHAQVVANAARASSCLQRVLREAIIDLAQGLE